MATYTLSSQCFGILVLLLLAGGISGQTVPPCTGQTLGNSNFNLTGASTGPNTGFSYIFLDPSMKVPCCGVISQWMFATKAAGDFTAQVWRQSAGSTYEVIGEKTTTVTSDNNMVISIGTSEQPTVKQNDYIGWHSSGADIVPYTATASAVMGKMAKTGKTNKGGTTTWTGATTNGEQWMFGAILSGGTAPTFGTTLPASVTAQTTDANGVVVHKVTPTDINPDDIASLTVSITTTGSAFNYDTATGDVKVLTTPLSVGTHEVVFEVVDQCELTGTGTLTIVVSDNKPNITSLPIAAALLKEDAPTNARSLLHTLVFTDDGDLNDVSCTMTNNTGTPFDMVRIPSSANYGIYFVPSETYPLNYDVTPLYRFFITCNDGTSNSDTREFQVSIQPNNEPTLTLPTNTDVDAETTKSGAVVLTAAATDTDGGALTYSMANCSCPLAMNPNGELYVTEDLNTHKVSPYNVNITVSDGYNTVTKITTITITNINHPPNITNPTQTSPNEDNFHISEHTDEGTPNAKGATIDVTTVLGIDEDSDTLTFEFDPVNSQGQDFFNFDTTTGKITTKTDLDYETLFRQGLTTTKVYVRAYDGREYSETRILNIIVDDVNETPVFTQNLYAIETGETTGTATLPCPLFAVVEEDSYDTRTYDINCGTVGHFHIPSTRGSECDAYIVQTEEDDQDSPGAASETVSCIITVTDKGGLTATATLQITVNEEDDNPPVLTQTSYTYTISNDTTPGNTFGNADATDDDFLAKHKRHTYTTDSSDFGVDENGVFFAKTDFTNVNAPTTRTFTLTVTDDAGHTDTAPVTVNIIDIVTTTAATTTAAAVSSSYSAISSFFDDPGNLAWFIPALLLGLAALGLLGFMLYKCFSSGLCGRICKSGGGIRRIGHMRGGAPPKGRMVVRRVVKVPQQRMVTKRVVTVGRQVPGGPVPVGPQTQPFPQQLGPPPPHDPFQPPPSPHPPKKSSVFDCFKRSTNPDPAPNKPNIPEPLNANEGKPWQP